MGSNGKPHVICIAFPAQSHVMALLKMAKLLHSRGFHVTFVNTDFNHARMLDSGVTQLPNFQFEQIGDGTGSNTTLDLASACTSIRADFLVLFRNLIAKINSSSKKAEELNSPPPVSCIVADGFMTFSIKVARDLGIPVAVFFTISACGFMGCKQYKALKDRGMVPLKDESYLTNGYLDTPLDWIPAMKDIRLRDLPTFLRTTDPNDVLFNTIMDATENAPQASATILHTFDALEMDILEALSLSFPRICAIGPLQLLLDQISINPSIDYNPWKEDVDCLQWLDLKEPDSVIYVNFGSIIVLTKEQLVEFGMGLAKSNYHFLWVIRPDLVIGESGILPPEFADETKDRGFITSWCPQVKVLNHPSVGGFLTHCGWNSTLESIYAGVPMICWPFFGDQQMNCKYCCREWGIGLEIGEDVSRGKVGKLVKELMEGEVGKRMKGKVMEWKQLAEEAVAPQGSSLKSFNQLVEILTN